jgi:hypothetical protein
MKSFGRQFGWANFWAHFSAAVVNMPTHKILNRSPCVCKT